LLIVKKRKAKNKQSDKKVVKGLLGRDEKKKNFGTQILERFRGSEYKIEDERKKNRSTLFWGKQTEK
jgi:hypothetical protein